jgi:hypothetical protein
MTSIPAPKRPWSRLRVGLTAAIGIALLAAFLVRASRPRWHTTVSPVNAQSGVALSIQYPDGWEQVDVGTIRAPGNGTLWAETFAGTTGIFTRQSPHGLNRWMQEYLFKQDFSESKQDKFLVRMRVEDRGLDDYLKLTETTLRVPPNYKHSARRVQNPLGPAIEENMWPTRMSPHPLYVRSILIFCKDTFHHHKVNLSVDAYGREDVLNWPEFEEVVRRVRLVPAR